MRRKLVDECDAAARRSPGQQGKMKTILLVDDEAGVVNAWRRILRLEGCRVVTDSNGYAGFVIAREERPDLIITDRSVPIMDGVEFCRQLKLESELVRIPLILTSAAPLKHDDTELWDEFWQKPVAIETVRASLVRFFELFCLTNRGCAAWMSERSLQWAHRAVLWLEYSKRSRRPQKINLKFEDGFHPEVTDAIIQNIRVCHLGETTEIASKLSWLASDDTAFATGTDFSPISGLPIRSASITFIERIVVQDREHSCRT